MKIILIIAASAFAGFVAGTIRDRRIIERQRKTIRALRARNGTAEEKAKTETMKKIVGVCLANGILWIWCSYVLAWMDKPQIAESLSSVAVTEIIGVVLAYAIKSVVENLSKNNHWPDKGAPTGTDSSTAGPEPEQEEPPDVGL